MLNCQVLNRKITTNKTKHLLVEYEFKKLKIFDSGYFKGKSHFVDNDGTENYLVFQPIYRYFKVIANTKYISEWKSKGLSNEGIKPPATSDNTLSPLVGYLGNKIKLKLNGGCLKQQNKLIDAHRTIAKIFIVYASGSFNDDLTLKNSLFGAVRLTKNADIDKQQYSSSGTGFDRKGSFSFPSRRFGRNVIIFGVDMSSSVHVDNKKMDILILGKGPIQGSKHTLTAEKMY